MKHNLFTKKNDVSYVDTGGNSIREIKENNKSNDYKNKKIVQQDNAKNIELNLKLDDFCEDKKNFVLLNFKLDDYEDNKNGTNQDSMQDNDEIQSRIFHVFLTITNPFELKIQNPAESFNSLAYCKIILLKTTRILLKLSLIEIGKDKINKNMQKKLMLDKNIIKALDKEIADIVTKFEELHGTKGYFSINEIFLKPEDINKLNTLRQDAYDNSKKTEKLEMLKTEFELKMQKKLNAVELKIKKKLFKIDQKIIYETTIGQEFKIFFLIIDLLHYINTYFLEDYIVDNSTLKEEVNEIIKEALNNQFYSNTLLQNDINNSYSKEKQYHINNNDYIEIFYNLFEMYREKTLIAEIANILNKIKKYYSIFQNIFYFIFFDVIDENLAIDIYKKSNLITTKEACKKSIQEIFNLVNKAQVKSCKLIVISSNAILQQKKLELNYNNAILQQTKLELNCNTKDNYPNNLFVNMYHLLQKIKKNSLQLFELEYCNRLNSKSRNYKTADEELTQIFALLNAKHAIINKLINLKNKIENNNNQDSYIDIFTNLKDFYCENLLEVIKSKLKKIEKLYLRININSYTIKENFLLEYKELLLSFDKLSIVENILLNDFGIIFAINLNTIKCNQKEINDLLVKITSNIPFQATYFNCIYKEIFARCNIPNPNKSIIDKYLQEQHRLIQNFQKQYGNIASNLNQKHFFEQQTIEQLENIAKKISKEFLKEIYFIKDEKDEPIANKFFDKIISQFNTIFGDSRDNFRNNNDKHEDQAIQKRLTEVSKSFLQSITFAGNDCNANSEHKQSYQDASNANSEHKQTYQNTNALDSNEIKDNLAGDFEDFVIVG